MSFSVRTAADCMRFQSFDVKPNTIKIYCQHERQPSNAEMRKVLHSPIKSIQLFLSRKLPNVVHEVDDQWLYCIRHSGDMQDLSHLSIQKGWLPLREPKIGFYNSFGANLTRLNFTGVKFGAFCCLQLSKTLRQLNALKEVTFYTCEFHGPSGALALASLKVPRLCLGISHNSYAKDLMRLKPEFARYENGVTPIPMRYYHFTSVVNGSRSLLKYLNSVVEKADGLKTSGLALRTCLESNSKLFSALRYMVY